MASSKPILGIQSPIQCQLCERDPKISWKCLECDLLMCSACKNKIHPKIKTAGEHKIIATKDIGSPPSVVPSKIDMTVVETYQTKLDPVREIAISSDGLLWISDGHRKKRSRFFTAHTGLQKVKCEGNNLKVVSCFTTGIFGIALTPGNDLLIADDSKLKQIKSGTNKIIDTAYDVGSSEPLAIHVTRKNKTIVGLASGSVIVMDFDGKREKVYEKSNTKDTLVYPREITSTGNDNIFVVDDATKENGRRVVVLGHEDIINTYSGHAVINTEDRQFDPQDLATTPSDNVIVADGRNILHILNSTGYLVSYINTEDKGIRHPYSIGIATEEQSCILYIGTFEKIYKLNLIGC